MTPEEREAYRRSADGHLTVWGARDLLLETALGAIDRALELRTRTKTLQRMAPEDVRELEQRMDDLTDAVMRTHDDFGCAEGRAEDEGRYTCKLCVFNRRLMKGIDDAYAGRTVSIEIPPLEELDEDEDEEVSSMTVESEDADDAINVGSITVPVWVRRSDLAIGRVDAYVEDEEDRAFHRAMRRARRVAREDDAENLPEDLVESLDQLARGEVVEVTLSSEDGDFVVSHPEVVRGGRRLTTEPNTAGWTRVSFPDPVRIEAGDVLAVRFVRNDAGQLVASDLYVESSVDEDEEA